MIDKRARRDSGCLLGVQGVLNDDDSSSLVDDRTSAARVAPSRPEPPGCLRGRESLIEQADGNHHAPLGQPQGEVGHIGTSRRGCRPLAAVESQRKTDDDLQGFVLAHEVD